MKRRLEILFCSNNNTCLLWIVTQMYLHTGVKIFKPKSKDKEFEGGTNRLLKNSLFSH
jgi:hypothetical protein